MSRRIALDVTALLGPRTGIGVFTRELLDGLSKRSDVALTAYATSWRGRTSLHDLVPDGTAISRPMAARPLRRVWRSIDGPPLEWFTGDVEVVHGPNYVVPPTRRAARIVSVHDVTFLRYPELSTADTLEYPALLRRAIRSGAWVHVDATSVAAEVIDAFGAPADRVVVVPLAPSPVPDADPADGRSLAGGDRFVLALGTVEPRKDLPGLVAAFDALASDRADLRLVIAGPDGWGADALHDAIDRSAFADRIVRLGWVTDAQRGALLRAATVLAYPSRYEGFGLPPLEAMSVGTPVVTTTAGALPETCGDAALLVEPGDPDALAGALARVLDEPVVALDFRSRGIARADSFSWPRTVAGLADLYHRIAP